MVGNIKAALVLRRCIMNGIMV